MPDDLEIVSGGIESCAKGFGDEALWVGQGMMNGFASVGGAICTGMGDLVSGPIAEGLMEGVGESAGWSLWEYLWSGSMDRPDDDCNPIKGTANPVVRRASFFSSLRRFCDASVVSIAGSALTAACTAYAISYPEHHLVSWLHIMAPVAPAALAGGVCMLALGSFIMINIPQRTLGWRCALGAGVAMGAFIGLAHGAALDAAIWHITPAFAPQTISGALSGVSASALVHAYALASLVAVPGIALIAYLLREVNTTAVSQESAGHADAKIANAEQRPSGETQLVLSAGHEHKCHDTHAECTNSLSSIMLNPTMIGTALVVLLSLILQN